MHTHQQAGLRIATCGLLVLAFASSAEDGIATGAAQAPVLVLESPPPQLPVVAVSELGHAVAVDRLSALRGGDGNGGDGNGGVGNGATGGAGGAGGSVAVDAGAFDMSNNMTSVGQSAAGIMVAAQNSGMASLIQQGITVQANLTVGP